MPSNKSLYTLSLRLSRNCANPQWALFLHAHDRSSGHLFQVFVMEPFHKTHQFEHRIGVPIASPESAGLVELARLDGPRFLRAAHLIEREPPPCGEEQSKDWVFRCLMELEIEDVIEHGTCHLVDSWTSRSVHDIKKMAQMRWKDCPVDSRWSLS